MILNTIIFFNFIEETYYYGNILLMKINHMYIKPWETQSMTPVDSLTVWIIIVVRGSHSAGVGKNGHEYHS